MTDYEEYEEPSGWAEKSMTFDVKITNVQEEFFIREVADRLCEKVSRDALNKIDEIANSLIEDRLRARMDAVIADVIEKGLSAEVQPSDKFSNPKGEPITPAEFIARGAEAYLEEIVDSDGKPVSGGYRSHGQGQKRINRFLSQVITKQFDDEVKAEVKGVVLTIREQMKDAASAWLAKFQGETAAGIEKAKSLTLPR